MPVAMYSTSILADHGAQTDFNHRHTAVGATSMSTSAQTLLLLEHKTMSQHSILHPNEFETSLRSGSADAKPTNMLEQLPDPKTLRFTNQVTARDVPHHIQQDTPETYLEADLMVNIVYESYSMIHAHVRQSSPKEDNI